MAKPQVTLTLAGDSSQLQKSFDRVGGSAQEMSGEVGTASSDMSSSFSSMEDRVGNSEQRIRDFRDVIDGTGDVARGFAEGDISMMTRGFADIAGGLAGLVIPSLKRFGARLKATRVGMAVTTAATKTMAAAQRVLNLAMRANPIGIIITLLAALVGGIVVAYKNSETFRNIVQSAMGAVRNAFGWVINRGGDLVNWFKKLPGRIGSFFSGLGDTITQPFRTAFGAVRAAWNSTIGGKGFSVPGWVPGIGGNSFRIPTFHQGGVVPGAPGTETVARLQAGERVTPAGQSAGPRVVLELASSGSRLDDLLLEILRRSIRVRGGDAQAVLGGRAR